MKPLISAIIPNYNGAQFVKYQLEIIKRQEINAVEVIFVDNNSQDDSVEILKREIASGEWPFEIILLSESKQGAGAARNKGLANARGEFVAFLDIDDEILPGKWEKDLEIFAEHPDTDFVFCRTKRIYENGRSVLHDVFGFQLGINEPSKLGYLIASIFFKVPGTPSALIRTEAARSVDGYEESVRIGEDAMFFIKLGHKKVGYFYDEIYFHYYKRSTSTTVIRNKQRSSNLDNYILKKQCIIPFYIQEGDLAFASQLKYKQIFLLRLLLIEKIYDWNKVKEELALLGIKIPKLIWIDLFLVRNFGLAIKHRFNPFLRLAKP